ncbi:histidine kinase [Stappia sp. GBMRC 2046]|uniref:histidine kinase n=1 Tax=Stappia sediminis TaxID=2692190 RepID=A0A7X3LRA9_9HYPH|nr:CHASE domain-containing protein [Stappia sediminis]MXN63635.1 histidine kinase [Stappia sediminis]
MRRYLPSIIFLVVAAIGVARGVFAWLDGEAANRAVFQNVAQEAIARIETRVKNHILLLQATRAYFIADDKAVNRKEFSRFIESIDRYEYLAGVQGIGYAPLVPADDGDLVSRELRANYGVERAPWPRTDQDLRTPIVILEPQNERNRAALAYDMYSQETRRAAMELAISTGEPQASGKVELVQETSEDKQAGFLIYTPLYAGDKGGPAVERKPAGFVYAPFRVGDLFRAALGRTPDLPVHISAYDGFVENEALLFRSEGEPAEFPQEIVETPSLQVAGRTWHFEMRPSRAFVPVNEWQKHVVFALASILLAAALAASARWQQRAMEAGEKLTRETQRNLQERDLLLQEMKHRIKNMIARVLAIARQTARGADNVDEFVVSLTQRLEAMAASQDLLARSKWQSADLRTLLVQELKQVFGDDIDEATLHGEAVTLNETAAQAFGLTFHELATNALKYGFAQHSEGQLSVSWSKSGSAAGSLFRLVWVEHGDGVTGSGVPEGGGFGTRLIDASVRMELGGRIERNKTEDRFEVIIEVPLNAVEARIPQNPAASSAEGAQQAFAPKS